MEIKLPIILTLTVAGDNWVVFYFGCLYLAPTKLEAQCDSKSLLLLLPGIIHSVQHFTDWAIMDKNYDSSPLSMIRYSIFNTPPLSHYEHFNYLPVAH